MSCFISSDNVFIYQLIFGNWAVIRTLHYGFLSSFKEGIYASDGLFLFRHYKLRFVSFLLTVSFTKFAQVSGFEYIRGINFRETQNITVKRILLEGEEIYCKPPEYCSLGGQKAVSISDLLCFMFANAALGFTFKGNNERPAAIGSLFSVL